MQASLKEKEDHRGFIFPQSKVDFGVQFLTFGDIIEDDISSVVRNAALKVRTWRWKQFTLSWVVLKWNTARLQATVYAIHKLKSINKIFLLEVYLKI